MRRITSMAMREMIATMASTRAGVLWWKAGGTPVQSWQLADAGFPCGRAQRAAARAWEACGRPLTYGAAAPAADA